MVVLNTINPMPMNSKKWVTTFLWIFHFSVISFFVKNYENSFHNDDNEALSKRKVDQEKNSENMSKQSNHNDQKSMLHLEKSDLMHLKIESLAESRSKMMNFSSDNENIDELGSGKGHPKIQLTI